MAGKKKKRKQSDISSVSQPQLEEVPGGSSHSVTNMSNVMKTLQALTSQIQDHELKTKALTSQIQDHELKLKLKLVLKKYVKDQGLYLVNELLAFISQIHGTGLQHKFDNAYVTGKFHKLGSNRQFTSDCQEFLQSQSDPDGKSTSDIVNMFNSLCNERALTWDLK